MLYSECALHIVNCLAVMIDSIGHLTDLQLSLYTAHPRFQPIHEEIRAMLDRILADPEPSPASRLAQLRETISSLLQTIQAPSFDVHERTIYLLALICSIDQRICYEPLSEGTNRCRISLAPLLHQKTDAPILIEALNSNGADTNVYLHPKFPVSVAITQHGPDRSARPLAVRNALHGLNGKLCSILYYQPSETDSGKKRVVHSVILPERAERSAAGVSQPPEKTRILFAPLSDARHPLDMHCIEGNQLPYHIGQIPYRGITISGVADPDGIETRYQEDFMEACKQSPDIFFGPEMLATDSMAEIRNHTSPFLKELMKKAAYHHLRPPRLTILPTHWRDGCNRVLLFSETGRFLGDQFKMTPFVDEKNGLVEALDLSNASPGVLLIHMVNQQRVAIVICAEFLADPDYVQNFLCGQLGATLILIPSFSRGEQDFIARLPSLKPYGTTVIWGNCCAAVQPLPAKDGEGPDGKSSPPFQRIIGACSYAGMDVVDRFGSHAACRFCCRQQSYCFFVVDVPTRVAMEKPDSSSAPDIIHICSHPFPEN